MDTNGTVQVPVSRAAIIEVATRLIGERGFPATSMRDIAREVGILAGSLYAHIDGKESILLEIIERSIEEYITEGQRAELGATSSEERLRALISAHVEVVARGPSTTKIVFHQWRYLGEANRSIVRGYRDQYEQLFAKAISDGIADGTFTADLHVPTMVRTVLGALNWTPEWLSTEGPDPIDVVTRRLADTLLVGVLARDSS